MTPRNAIVAMIRMCLASITIGEISTPDFTKKGKKRPKVRGKIANRETEFLIDTGASVSVCSEKMFLACWKNWEVKRLPLPQALRLSGVTGHDINIVDYVELKIEIEGREFVRPMLIVSGLDKTHCILGYDFVKEEGLIIDGAKDKIYFDSETRKNWDRAAIQNLHKVSIPPRTIQHVEAIARTGTKCIDKGEVAFCTPAQFTPVGFYDTLTKIETGGRLTLAVINSTDSKVTLQGSDTLGFAYRLADYFDSIEPLNDESIETIFGEI